MATIATVSTKSPSSAETTAAARRTATIVEANWERKMRPGRSGGPSGSSLGPLARRRAAASAPVSPDPGSVRSSRTTSAISRRRQSPMVSPIHRGPTFANSAYDNRGNRTNGFFPVFFLKVSSGTGRNEWRM